MRPHPHRLRPRCRPSDELTGEQLLAQAAACDAAAEALEQAVISGRNPLVPHASRSQLQEIIRGLRAEALWTRKWAAD